MKWDGSLLVQITYQKKMAESELRFRRNVKIDDKEESVDLLTLAMKKNAEYTKVGCLILED